MNKWQKEGLLIGFRKEKIALPHGHYLHSLYDKDSLSNPSHWEEYLKTMLQNFYGWLSRVF